MREEFVPKIRLEIDFMKASMIQALGVDGSEVSKHIQAAIDKAVAEIDYEAIVKGQVDNAVRSGVKNYFEHGQGKIDVNNAVDAALDSLRKKVAGKRKS